MDTLFSKACWDDGLVACAMSVDLSGVCGRERGLKWMRHGFGCRGKEEKMEFSGRMELVC